MQLEQVDVIRSQPLQRLVHRSGQVAAGGADIVGRIAEAEGGLGGEDQAVARPAFDRAAQDLLSRAGRIDVGGVEQGDPGVQADIDQPARLLNVGRAPGLEELALAAEGAGAEAKHRNGEAGCAEATMFHEPNPAMAADRSSAVPICEAHAPMARLADHRPC